MSADTSSNIVAQWEQLDHHFAEVAPGIKLHYVDAGPRDATPVVLVHGWPDLAFAWRVSGQSVCVLDVSTRTQSLTLALSLTYSTTSPRSPRRTA